jgi:hypothetical protein
MSPPVASLEPGLRGNTEETEKARSRLLLFFWIYIGGNQGRKRTHHRHARVQGSKESKSLLLMYLYVLIWGTDIRPNTPARVRPSLKADYLRK